MTQHRKLKNKQHETPPKTRGDFRCKMTDKKVAYKYLLHRNKY